MDCLASMEEYAMIKTPAKFGLCPVWTDDGMTESVVEACAPPQRGSTAQEFGFDDAFSGREGPGQLGMLCAVAPPGAEQVYTCEEELTCVPLETSTVGLGGDGCRHPLPWSVWGCTWGF